MYESYWGLDQSPFQHHCHARWFHESPIHEEALARLFFLVENRRRFGLLQGAAGTGKSLLFHVLAGQLARSQRQTVSIDLSGLDGEEFTWQLALGLQAAPRADESAQRHWRRIDDQLRGLAAARLQTVFLFDNLDLANSACTRVLRRLYHFDAGAESRLTFLAAARPTLATTRDTADLAEFLSEASELRVELLPLDATETGRYLHALCARAGRERELFTPEAVTLIHRESGGIPRFISRLADLSLLAAMMDHRETVDAETVASTLGELQVPTRRSPSGTPLAV